MIDLKELVKSGVHFGHRRSRRNPKMDPYIWGFRSDTHLIDVSKTAHQMEKAAAFLEKTASEGKTILWVGTKKAARNSIKAMAAKFSNPSVTHRWIGGTLTNHSQVKKSVTKMLHLEDVLSKSAESSHYTKKEFGVFQKTVDRLQKNVGSIRKFSFPVGAVVIVDVKKEQTALKEAGTMGIPVVGLVDTNSDPTMVDYVIPSNDDSAKAIDCVLNYLAGFVEKGHVVAQAEKEKIKQQKAAEKAEKEEKKKAAAKEASDKKEASKKKEPAKKDAEPKKATAKKVEKKVAVESPKADAPKKEAKKTDAKEATAKGTKAAPKSKTDRK